VSADAIHFVVPRRCTRQQLRRNGHQATSAFGRRSMTRRRERNNPSRYGRKFIFFQNSLRIPGPQQNRLSGMPRPPNHRIAAPALGLGNRVCSPVARIDWPCSMRLNGGFLTCLSASGDWGQPQSESIAIVSPVRRLGKLCSDRISFCLVAFVTANPWRKAMTKRLFGMLWSGVLICGISVLLPALSVAQIYEDDDFDYYDPYDYREYEDAYDYEPFDYDPYAYYDAYDYGLYDDDAFYDYDLYDYGDYDGPYGVFDYGYDLDDDYGFYDDLYGDDLYGDRYESDPDEFEEPHRNWFGGYDDAGEVGLFDW
jgi:hypothetical protein